MNQMDIASKVRSTLSQSTKQFVGHAFLDQIESGSLSKEEWRLFAAQRYLAAHDFENLLEVSVEEAKNLGFKHLAEVLQSNLNDEKGVDADGNALAEGSHAKWRQDFYSALGLPPEILDSKVALAGTKKYCDLLSNLIVERNLMKILGALLMLEYSIPEEFKRIKVGRDLTFKDEFVFESTDSPEVRRKKGFARLYIDHHIYHDAESHYPDLEEAVFEIIDEEAMNDLLEGIRLLGEAKSNFYDGFEMEV